MRIVMSLKIIVFLTLLLTACDQPSSNHVNTTNSELNPNSESKVEIKPNQPQDFCKIFKPQVATIDESILTVQNVSRYDIHSNRFFPNLDKRSPGKLFEVCLAEVYYVTGEMKHELYELTRTEEGEVFIMLHDIEDQWQLEQIMKRSREIENEKLESSKIEMHQGNVVPDTEREIPRDEVSD